MRDEAAFKATMRTLALNARVELTEAQFDLFWTMLADFTDEQFQQAAFLWIQTSKFLPMVCELREKITPFVSPEGEAGDAFDRVCRMGHYSPQGYHWNIREIADCVGACAAVAYQAAGGSRAFDQEQGERNLPFLRNRFVDAYVDAFHEARAGRMVAPASAMPGLPAGSSVRDMLDATTRALSLPASSQ